jgi:hypothetical protein
MPPCTFTIQKSPDGLQRRAALTNRGGRGFRPLPTSPRSIPGALWRSTQSAIRATADNAQTCRKCLLVTRRTYLSAQKNTALYGCLPLGAYKMGQLFNGEFLITNNIFDQIAD